MAVRISRENKQQPPQGWVFDNGKGLATSSHQVTIHRNKRESSWSRQERERTEGGKLVPSPGCRSAARPKEASP